MTTAPETTPIDDVDDESPTEFVPGRSGARPFVSDSLTRDTDGQVLSRRARLRRRLLTRAVPVAALLGITAWSLVELSGLDSSRASRVRSAGGLDDRSAAVKSGAVLPIAPSATDDGVRGPEDEPETEPIGKKLGKVLETIELQRIRPPETAEQVTMNQAVLAGSVTVINLWATHCKPCKEELPGLKDMFAAGQQRGWGPQVRFVPVRVEDSTDAVLSFKKFAADMPPTDAFLIDPGVAGGVRAAMVTAGLFAEKDGIPITLALDCKQSVRWQRIGRLGEDEFTALAAMVDTLAAELPTRYCQKRRRPSRSETRAVEPADKVVPPVSVSKPPPLIEKKTPPIPSRSNSCGDDKCSANEHCQSCPADCACAPDRTCKKMTSGGYFCKEALQ